MLAEVEIFSVGRRQWLVELREGCEQVEASASEILMVDSDQLGVLWLFSYFSGNY